LAEPRKDDAHTIYRWSQDKWIKLPGKAAEEIAIGRNGLLYQTHEDNSIWMGKLDASMLTPMGDCQQLEEDA
jgi:hypothetical protein